MSSGLKQSALNDPLYLERHLAAVKVLGEVRAFKWYDSRFLWAFEAAQRYLRIVRPDALAEFVAGFSRLRPPADFEPRAVSNPFSGSELGSIREICGNLPADLVKGDEMEQFGRELLRDHPCFVRLQQKLTPLVSELAGQPLELGYNFLSLYGPSGRCEVHLDEPISMFTLDLCIDQSEEWPIYFSRIVDWPTAEEARNWQPGSVREDRSLEFRPFCLQPGNALLFCGSSQWHYREAIAPGGFCNLLFFHFFPEGCEDLVLPTGWARFFDMPELQPFCDLFEDSYADVIERRRSLD